jgi:polysaccharide biosynthesis protein PelE
MIRPLLLLMTLVAALVMEISAMAVLWPSGTNDRVLYVGLLQHAAASLLLTLACWHFMPEKFRHPRWPISLLLFNFAFFMPVLGMFGMYAAVLVSAFRRREKISYPFARLILPEFVLSLREPEMKFSQGGIKSRLGHSAIPTPQRLQSLLALQGIPARVSSPCCKTCSAMLRTTSALSLTACLIAARKRSPHRYNANSST